MADRNAAFRQQILNVPQAEGEAMVGPNGIANGRAWKAIALQGRGGDRQYHLPALASQIGTGNLTIPSKVLPSYVKTFWDSRQDVKLRLIECSMDDVVKGIRSQDFELGLGLLTHVPSDLTQIRWLPMHHYIIAHESHDIWNAPVNLEAISKHNLILPPITEYAQTGSALLSALSKKGMPFNVTLEASSNDRCIEYARNGMGIFFALCCDEMLVDLPTDMRIKNLQHLFRSENIGVFYDGARKQRPRDEQFLDQLGLDR